MAKTDLTIKEKNKIVKEYNTNKAYDNMRREQRSEIAVRGLGAIKLVIGLLLIIMLISFLQGQFRIPTFSGFLEGLSSFDIIPSVPFLDLTAINLGNWDINIWNSFEILGINFPAFVLRFNWLRDIFAYGLNIVNVLVFLFNGIISICNFVVFFVRWIFI